MTPIETALTEICQKIEEREHFGLLTFQDFLELCAAQPNRIIRNIFQIFYDMVYSHVGDGIDDYPGDPESIKYVYYDCTNLFVKGVDHPFFADRLFANRFISHITSFKRGAQQNRIYIFQGPHGSGKSTFLNNLLLKFEQYTKTEEGASYEVVWRLNKKELGATPDLEAQSVLLQFRSLLDDSTALTQESPRDKLLNLSNNEYLEVPCPSHDHPLLLIPKAYRKDLLDDLIKDEQFKHKLFFKKPYEWVFRDQPCTICMSLYQTLLDMFHSPSKVFEMVFARRYHFNRRLGEGISVFNPGDTVMKNKVVTNQLLQNQLNSLLKDSNRVQYIFSRYAKTNNGIYALMDVKSNNKDRFENLHGIISEGVHKVEDIEENVNSLFMAIMNPEDGETINGMQSFSDRITSINISYVLDYNTEVKIYKHVFGDQIEPHFLPRILENFAKVIISSRLNPESEGVKEWIEGPGKYRLYCDQNLQLLKMDIYAGLIPAWLSEEDRKKFTAKRRRKIIAESESEGNKGFSGRESLSIFNEFYSAYAKKDKPITMAMVHGFFKKYSEGPNAGTIPEGFLDSLVCLYDYTVLQEVKESLYSFNEERISKEIQNYLFAINFDVGRKEKCSYTGEELEISEDFFESFERRVMGPILGREHRRSFREDVQHQYTSKALTQEMLLDGKQIHETKLYQTLYQRYVHNLKENVLDPFVKNDNFRSAIKDYATKTFKSYDRRIREEVSLLMQNLKNKYGYSEQGAKEVCIYVIDNDLAAKFSQS